MRWLQGFVALSVLLIVVGFAFGGGGLRPLAGLPASPDADGTALVQRDGKAPRAVADEVRDFRFIRYQADLSSAAPRACAVFSAALNPSIDYGPFVRLEPRRATALGVTGDTLCVGGLGFSDTAVMTLLAGLPAADGRTLQASEAVQIEFSDRPAYVGFKGAGVILPRLDADGLAIETVNVDTVKVSVRRVNDRALVFKRISEGETLAPGDYSWRYGEDDPDDVATPIWSGEMDTKGDTNAAVATVFPLAKALGKLQPGAYFIEVEQVLKGRARDESPARSSRWIVFTDIALTSYSGESGLLVVARSLQSARPMRGVSLSLLAKNNEVLGTAVTDGDGRATFAAPLLQGTGTAEPRLVVASGSSGDFAALDLERAPLDLSKDDTGGRVSGDGADSFVWLDRGIYRPGETVNVAALVRDGAGRSLPQAGALVIRRPNGVEAERVRFDGKAQAASFSQAYTLPKGAQRGLWSVAVELDGLGVVGSESFSVEDFVPQRIAVEAEAGTDALQSGQQRPIRTTARFLYGAPGAGLPVSAEARIGVDGNPFPAFEGFRFGRDDTPFYEEFRELVATVTDGAGSATLAFDPGDTGRDATMPLRVRSIVSVTEPGGRAVRETVSFPYRPAAIYLGIKQEAKSSDRAGETSTLSFATVGASGEPVSRDIRWRLLAINYRYDWYRDEGGTWRWRSTRTVTIAGEGAQKTDANGRAVVSTRPLEGGDYQIIVEDAGGTSQSASLSFYAGWGGPVEEGVAAPDRVRVSGPSAPVQVGGRAEINLVAPYNGEADVVIASDRILYTVRVAAKTGGTRISVPVTADWGAGAYAMVSVYTPRDAVRQSRPRRAVGVVYLPVNTGNRTFKVDITSPEVARPETTVNVEVKLSGGPGSEKAYVTLAAVDEGILRLTRFQSPDPTAWYFGKKALGVGVRDDYGRLLDPNLGAAAEIRSGGDMLGGEGLSVVPVKSVALFSGVVEVKGGKAVVPLALPDFNGELRLMAVAWSNTGVGQSSQAMKVRAPVTADLILPRFLAPGDVATVTASLDNVEGTAGTYQTSLSASGAAQTGGSASTSVNLDKSQRRDLGLSLTATTLGVAGVSLKTTGPGGFAAERSTQIEVRSPFTPTRFVERALMRPGESIQVGSAALSGLTAASARVDVSFSPLPFDAHALSNSLSDYPYGCTEQIASQSLPILLNRGLKGVLGDPSGSGADRLQEAVSTILNRQDNSGAIGLWRIGDGNSSPWIGAYATDFILRANEAGLPVPDAAVEIAIDGLGEIATGETWRLYGYANDGPWIEQYKGERERGAKRAAAYALYLLAREGEADVSRLRYMHDRELSNLNDPLSRAHIGAGLALLGDVSRANSAFRLAEQALGYKNPVDYYQSPLRDLAGVTALAAEAGLTDVVERLGQRLAQEVREPEALTTQEKAFLLMAADALIGDQGISVKAPDGAVTGKAVAFGFGASELATTEVFANTGQKPIWRTIVRSGTPTVAPPAAADGVALSKSYHFLDGRTANLADIRQGDQLVVKLTLSPRAKRLKPMIVSDLLPAGFEIEGVLQPEDAGERGAMRWLGEVSTPKVAQSQDDRFVAAVDLWSETLQIGYIVRAVTPGTFIVPGAHAEDMYDPTTLARTAASSLVIEPRG